MTTCKAAYQDRYVRQQHVLASVVGKRVIKLVGSEVGLPGASVARSGNKVEE